MATRQTTPMKPEVKELWLQALRSGEYFQGKGFLHTDRPGEHPQFCCLGVLCDIAVKLDPTILPVRRDATEVSYAGRIQFLPITIAEWAGLEGDSPEIEYEDLDYDADYPTRVMSLADMNDNGLDFKYIANMIERYL